MNLKSKPVILVIILAVVIAAVGLWYWQSRKSTPGAPGANSFAPLPSASVTKEAGGSVGTVIFEKTQNPASKLPETNPLKQIIKNPF